jgi:hypothetical protein
MLNITFGAVGAGAALRYGSYSTKMMRLRLHQNDAALTPQHWMKVSTKLAKKELK